MNKHERFDAQARITTTKIGSGFGSIEVVHDRDRCFGFIQNTHGRFNAFWSGDDFKDHPLGDFKTKTAALTAILRCCHE